MAMFVCRAESFQKEGYLTWESVKKKKGQYFVLGGAVYITYGNHSS